jgi:hypothetical protein
MAVIRGRFIACNHGLLDGHGLQRLPTGNVVNASFRTGRYDTATGLCIDGSTDRPYAVSRPCVTTNTLVTERSLTCQRWDPASRRWVKG